MGSSVLRSRACIVALACIAGCPAAFQEVYANPGLIAVDAAQQRVFAMRAHEGPRRADASSQLHAVPLDGGDARLLVGMQAPATAAFSPGYVAISTSDDAVLFDRTTLERKAELTGISFVELSAAADLGLTDDAQLIDLQSRAHLTLGQGTEGPTVTFSRDGATLVLVSCPSPNEEVRVRTWSTSTLVPLSHDLPAPERDFSAAIRTSVSSNVTIPCTSELFFSPDQRFILTSLRVRRPIAIDLQARAVRALDWPFDDDIPSNVGFAPDGDHAVLLGYRGMAWVDLQALATVDTAPVTAMTPSAAGTFSWHEQRFSASACSELIVLDVASGKVSEPDPRRQCFLRGDVIWYQPARTLIDLGKQTQAPWPFDDPFGRTKQFCRELDALVGFQDEAEQTAAAAQGDPLLVIDLQSGSTRQLPLPAGKP